mgnify:CR=1 FL=1
MRISSSTGDYKSSIFPEYIDAQIQVAYGKDGNRKGTFHTLFHEYKHLLQDGEGLFTREDTNLSEDIKSRWVR